MASRHGFRVFTEWHYFQLLEQLRQAEEFLTPAFWTAFNTGELSKLVLYGNEEELCPCPACGQANASTQNPSCWMTRSLQELASSAGIELKLKKIVSHSGDTMHGVEWAQETFSNRIPLDGAHLVWVNFVMVDSKGHPIPSARKSMFCLGNLMREHTSPQHPEVQKYRRFFELCLEAFPDKHEAEGMSPLLCKFLSH